MIRLIVLGSGGAMPTPKSIPAGYAVKFGGTFLFECPEGCQRQMMKYGANYGSLRAVFLSHLHADHFLGLFGLAQTLTLNGRKEELEIYGPKGTKKLFDEVFAIEKLKPGFPLKIKDIVAAREKKIFEEKLFSIRAFPVQHGCPALGFILQANESRNFDEKLAKGKGIHGPLFTEIQEKGKLVVEGKTIKLEDVTFVKQGKKIVFSGDTMPCPALEKAAVDADLLVCDSCFSEKQADAAKEKKHTTAVQAAKIAKKAKAKKLLLTHFSNRYENRTVLLEEAKKVFPESVLAQEGLELLV